MKKRAGKSKVIFDEVDKQILEIIGKKKEIRITDLRTEVGLAHPNLQTHLKRLEGYLEKRRDKQTIYLSLNNRGLIIMWMADIASPILKEKNGKVSDEFIDKLYKLIKEEMRRK